MLSKRAHILCLTGLLTLGLFLPAGGMTAEAKSKKPKLNKKEITLLTGDSYKLKVKNAEGEAAWESDDPEIASVSESGKVKAVGEGVTEIRMTADGVTKTCEVTVLTAKLETQELFCFSGETAKIGVKGSGQNGTWSAEDPDMVTFSEDGSFVAQKTGEVKLTYTVGQSTRSAIATVAKQDADKKFGTTLSYRRVAISSLRNYALGQNSRYRFLQGSATDGEYGYFILGDQNYANACAIVKMNLDDWTVEKVRTGLSIYHGNDMTYNSKKKRLVVVHGEINGHGDPKGISYINPKNLKVTKSLTLDTKVYGIGYDEKNNWYACGVAGSNRIVVKDEKFNTVSEFTVVDKRNYTRQGIDCDKSYIYILQSYLNAGRNRVLVYSWKGQYITEIQLKGSREGESLFHIGNKFIFSYNDGSYSGGGMLETAMKRYYQVRYTSGYGSGHIDSVMVKNGSGVKLAKNTFKKSGYKFAGWKLTRASDGKVLYEKKSNGKLKWLDPSQSYEKYKVCIVPNKAKMPSLSDNPGDCITCQAQWKEK